MSTPPHLPAKKEILYFVVLGFGVVVATSDCVKRGKSHRLAQNIGLPAITLAGLGSVYARMDNLGVPSGSSPHATPLLMVEPHSEDGASRGLRPSFPRAFSTPSMADTALEIGVDEKRKLASEIPRSHSAFFRDSTVQPFPTVPQSLKAPERAVQEGTVRWFLLQIVILIIFVVMILKHFRFVGMFADNCYDIQLHNVPYCTIVDFVLSIILSLLVVGIFLHKRTWLISSAVNLATRFVSLFIFFTTRYNVLHHRVPSYGTMRVFLPFPTISFVLLTAFVGLISAAGHPW